MIKMIRLTHARANGIKSGYWSPSKKEELVQRLAAYEDTGLEPEVLKRIQTPMTVKEIHIDISEKGGFAEHPVKTRQDLFLERYPNAGLDRNGIIIIMPCAMESKKCEVDDIGNIIRGCYNCRQSYWSQQA